MLSASLIFLQNYGVLALAIVVIAVAVFLSWLGFLKLVRPKCPDRTANGIAAGPIKVYDNRFLSIRLDELEKNLEKLGAIDPDKLDENVGTTQGEAASSTALGITVGANKPKENGADKSDGDKASPPDTPDLKLTQSARDRLAEQINLRYELVGLRMILERSLTDRLWPEAGAPDGARLQAVLGLQVSLDPPAQYKGCAACVELSLTSSGKPVSLIALLPQERTNNTLFINSRSGSASGAGEIQGRSFGLSWKRARKSTGLLAEAETVAFQRPPEASKASPQRQTGAQPRAHQQNGPEPLTVGWQFRPALNCPAVTPGLRQVFAVVALPSTDDPPVEHPAEPPVTIEATVRTYWRRYDRETGATSPRWSWIPWRLASDERQEPMRPVAIAFTEDTLEMLKPEVTHITTKQLSPEAVLVMVDGKNFFPGTSVVIGSKVHRDPATGLLIKSDEHLQVTTSPEELVYGEGFINGRYGRTVRLLIPTEVKGIWSVSWDLRESPGIEFQWLRIWIANTDWNVPLTTSMLANLPDPIVMVGDHVVTPPFSLYDASMAGYTCVAFQALVPAEWKSANTLMKVTFPFCGDAFRTGVGIWDPTPRFNFTIVHWVQASTRSFLITVPDAQFENLSDWSVELDKPYALSDPPPSDSTPQSPSLIRLSKTQIRLTVSAESSRQDGVLIVHKKDEGFEYIYPLQIPPPLTALQKPPLPAAHASGRAAASRL